MINIHCSYASHAQHSALPGWNDGVLATATTPVAGLICAGCAAYDTANPPAGVVNVQTIQQRIDTDLATLQTWVANNPNGAVLSGPQTLVVAKMLIGLAKLVRGAVTDTTGT